MIKIENVDVWGFEHAIRGMRNPLNSWDKSDSKMMWTEDPSYMDIGRPDLAMQMIIGENDIELMKKLFQAGTEHRKYLRQIFVSMDITAPLYWWKEFDTYKIGTVANSCSTMHKIADKEFTLDDFSVEHMTEENQEGFKLILNCLNTARQNFLETKDKMWWWQMIQTLPTSFNQKRTVTMNYENVVTIIKQRTGHKLDEWNSFCSILRQLPYIEEITKDIAERT